MNIFDPHITGSLSVSASAHIEGDLTVLGTIRGVAELTGEVGSAISASHAASYLLTSSFEGISGSFAITGSNIFEGDQTFSGSLLPQGTLTHDIGADTLRWRDLYLAGNTIDIGGTKISKNSDGDVELKDSSNGLKKLIASEIQIGSGVNRRTLRVSNGRFSLTNKDNITELANLSGSFEGSFIGDGSELTNVPASGVTGLSLDSISSGSNSLAMGVTTLVSNVSILPNITDTIDLGSPDKQWRDLFLSSGSLYINGQQVLSSTGNELRITTDTGESIKIIETSTDTITLQTEDGDITLTSSGNGNIELDAPIQIGAGNKILSSDGNDIQFGNGLSITGSIVLSGTVDGVDVAGLKTNVDAILSGSNANYDTFAEIVTLINSVDTSNDESFASHYTASNSRFNSIEITTSSFDGRIDSLETFTGSVDGTIRSDLNTYTSSNDGRLVSIESQTGSYLINTDLSTLEGQVSSLETESGSVDGRLDSLETTTGSINTKLSSIEITTGSLKGRVGSLESFTSSIDNTYATDSDVTTLRGDLNTYTSSNNTTNTTQNNKIGSLETTTGSLKGRVDSIESFTASIDDTYATDQDVTTLRGDLNSFTSSTNDAINVESLRINSLEGFTASIDDTYASDSDVTTLRTDLNTYTSSNDGRVDSLETESGSISGRVDTIEGDYATNTNLTTLRGDLNAHTSSNDTTNTNQGGRLDSLETESGSIRGTLNTFTSNINTTIKSKLNTETVLSGSIQVDVTQTTNYNQVTNRLDSVENFTSSVDGQVRTDFNVYTSSNDGNISTLNTHKSIVDGSLQFTGSNVTIKGNLLVKGTETRVNSTTVEVSDNIISLNGTGASDAGIEVRDVTSPGVLSGSLLWDGVTNYWKGGTKGNEERLLDNSDLTILDGRLDSLETESGSVKGRLEHIEIATGSLSIDITTLDGRLDSLETESGSVDGRLDTIESQTGSYQDGYNYSQVGHLPLSGGTITGNVKFNDDIQTIWGTGNDLKAWHNGINSYLFNYNGGLLVGSRNGDLSFLGSDGSTGEETYFFLDGSQRNINFQKDAIFTDNKKALFGGSGDLQIYHDGNNSYIKDTGTGALIQLTNSWNLNNAADTQNMITAAESGAVTLFNSGSAKLATTSTGVTVTGDIDLPSNGAILFDNTSNIEQYYIRNGGSSQSSLQIGKGTPGSDIKFSLDDTGNATFAGNVSLEDNKELIFGAATDFKIYHNSTTNVNHVSSQLDRQLSINGNIINLTNQAKTEKYLTGVNTGAVSLYYANALKIATTSTGVTVTGVIGATGGSSTNWNTAYGWGNHASAGYITSFTNTNEFVSGVTFNSADGVLTFTRNNGGDTFTVDIDGRHVLKGGDTMTGTLIVPKLQIGNATFSPSGDQNHVHFVGTALIPNTLTTSTNSMLGTSSYRWIGIYGGIGNFSGTVTGNSFVKVGGTSSQFLKADGSVDSSTYLTAHPSVVASASSNNSGRTYIQDILLDGFGHITGITTATETVVNTDTNYFVTGHTWNSTTGVLTTTLNDGSTTNVNLVNTLSDVTVTGGTYSSGTQILTLTKNDGNTVNVSGFAIDTDVNWYTTGSTFNSTNGVLTFTRNDGGTFIVDLDGKYSDLGHVHTFASLTSKPTTLSGYGITDAATSAQGTKADTAFGWGNHASAGYANYSHKYHTFSAGDEYYDSYDQNNNLRLFTENATFDNFRFRSYSNVEYFDGTNWVAWGQSLDTLFDGREETGISLGHANSHFRFEINRSSGWPTTALFVIQSSWTDTNSHTCEVTLETWNGSAWVQKDNWTYSDFQRGINLHTTTNVHDGNAQMRVTINMDWVDVSHNNYPIRRILLLSNFSGTAYDMQPFTWDYGKNVTFNSQIYVSGGNSSQWNTAYGWGNHASAGYLTAVPSSFSTNSITIGNAVTLTESTDRADLLSINSGTSGWGGLQITNTAGEGILSLMIDGSNGGLYDDQNGDWLLYYTKNGSVELRYNSLTRLVTQSDGVDIIGNLDLTGTLIAGNTFVNGLITGGFGSQTTDGTLDWNDSSNARSGQGYSLLLGNHSNGPTNTTQYFHPFSFEYSNKNGSGNLTQLAIPYTGYGLHYRSRYSDTWDGWISIWDTSHFSSTNISNWNTAYGWGDHAGLYSLAGHTHSYLPLAGGTLTGALTGTTATFEGIVNVNADLKINGSTGEDSLTIAPQAAGSGVFMLSLNAAGSAYEPFRVDAETYNFTNAGTSVISTSGLNTTFGGTITSGDITTSGDIISSAALFRIKGAGDVEIHLDDDNNSLSSFAIKDGANNSIFTLAEAGNATFAGTLSASGYNNTNWNTAYGWGDHALAGYTGDQDLSGYLPIGGKAADSNLLDGIDSTQFLRSDTSDTHTSTLTVNGQFIFNSSLNSSYREGIRLNVSTGGWGGAVFGGVRDSIDGITDAWWVSRNPSKDFVISYGTSANSGGLYLPYNSTALTYKNNRIWNAADFANNSTNWNTSYGWGNHAGLYSLLNHTHTFASLTSKPTTLSGYGITDGASSTHTHTFASLTSKPTTVSGYGITDMSSQSVSSATTATNLGADYTADDWFRATGDNNPVKFYGGSTQMTFRTDGATEAYSGVGAYPFVWSYGGSSATERIMLLATTGRIWSKVHGWLDEAFSTLNHTHTFASLTSKPTTLSGYGITDAASSTHTHTFASLTSKPTTLSGYGITDGATQSYVTTSISNLVDSAPGTLDTLNELAAALGDDPNFATTITTSIGNKLPLSGGTMSGKVTFPSAVGNRPQFPGGILGLNTSDGNFDIWGISTDYYPSHGTAANAWGLRWNGDNNDFEFVGGGTNRVILDMDGGNITSTGTITATGGNSTNWNTAYGWGNHAGLYLGATAKAADSNLLDGIDSGSFLRSDANDTASGNLYFSSSYNRFNTGNSNNTSTADTVGVYLHQSGYTDGRWTTRLRKYDHGGGVPLYIDNSAATANVFTAAARFGTYSGNGYTFEVFGSARVGGDFAATGQVNASGGNSTNWNTAYGWGNHSGLYSLVAHTHIISPINETAVPQAGISIQPGPGGDAGPGWAHPYGTRLSAIVSGGRSFEIMSTTYPNGNLSVRTLDSSNTWDSWKIIWDTSHFTSTNVSNWNTAYGWGNHGGLYSLLNHTHTFASLTSKPTTLSGYGITDAASSTHTHTFASLTSKPTTLSGYGITDAASSANVSNWNTAYGWGNHASAGYIVKGSEIASSSAWTTATKFGSVGELSGAAGNHALSVRSELGNDAFMSFHIGSDYAIHFGLDGASNRLHVGGWSDGTGTQYQMYDSRDGSASNWNTAYGWGNHASGGYLSTSGKAADSNLLDGLDSTAYMRDNGWNTNPGQDADAQPTMSSDFTYGNNAPHTGDLIRFGGGGYSLQLSSQYNGTGDGLSFRTRNGDNSTWNPWKTVFHSGIFTNNSGNWNTAYGWGNHGGLYSLLNHTHTFASLTSKPTTVSGYGITDMGSQSVSSATTLNSSNSISQRGSNGSWNADFTATPAGTVSYGGDVGANATNNPGGSWWIQQNFRHTNASNIWGTQVAWGWEDNQNKLATRNVSGGNWGAWVYYLNSSNYNSYTPTLTGTGASGTWSINISGTSDYATQWGTAAGYANFSSTAISSGVGWVFGTTGNGTYAPVSISSVSSLLNLSGTNTGDQTNISGNTGSVTNGVYTNTTNALSNSLWLNSGADVTTLAGSLTLYSSGNATTSMMMFKNTTGLGYGNHGAITGTYNTYFVMDTTDRGWIFRNATTSANVASVSNTGVITATTFSGALSGNAATATYATTAGSADQIDGRGFRNTGDNDATNADTINSNGITYYTGGVTNFSGNSTDGALYSQSYSSAWQHQIAGDFRSGQIAVRGKNSGTWQPWKKVALVNSTTFSSVPSVSFTHNLGTDNVIVQVYDSSGDLFFPSNIRSLSGIITVVFEVARSGRLVVTG